MRCEPCSVVLAIGESGDFWQKEDVPANLVGAYFLCKNPYDPADG